MMRPTVSWLHSYKNPVNIYSTCGMQVHAEINLIETEFEMGRIDDAHEHSIRVEKMMTHPDYDYAHGDLSRTSISQYCK
ncbi:MAG: hypothetical protein HN580_09045 [Deltaproteobacteria bacterium]|nr:hypothetical protein [Deltaproteobacteria bacterium]MBT4268448.1 hypothetical protein [Deltaproteobacteria bacterium]MBT4638565.1 hypothetical protein [Deltaproteobacteria bacterium]MBT6613196.1 hypothetical protein [Deltaproteobacteria bacterium]MBT7889155.1 hypothetical protein [Deltaproteobacteria bacterium]